MIPFNKVNNFIKTKMDIKRLVIQLILILLWMAGLIFLIFALYKNDKVIITVLTLPYLISIINIEIVFVLDYLNVMEKYDLDVVKAYYLVLLTNGILMLLTLSLYVYSFLTSYVNKDPIMLLNITIVINVLGNILTYHYINAYKYNKNEYSVLDSNE